MESDENCPLADNYADLEKFLKDKDRVIALVYASWCPFCRRILPTFRAYAKDEKRNLLLVADDEEKVCDKHDINVFPTLLFFEKGIVVKRLDGKPGVGLSEEQIADFIRDCP